MNVDFHQFQEKLKPANLVKILFILLEKFRSLIFITLLLGVFIYCGFLWYSYVYQGEWEESKKQEYINSKDKGVSFSREQFSQIVEKKEERAVRYHETLDNIPDIFRLKK